MAARTVWQLLLLSSLAMSSVATSCFLRSAVVLTPSPTPSRSMQARVIAVTDSIARLHGLKPKHPSDYCTVRGTKGIPDAAWQSGSFWGDLWLSTCVERAQPARMEIEIRRNGYWWKGKDKIIRQELSDALGAALTAESVAVVIDPK